MRSLRRRPRRTPAEDPEINRALEAMSAPELRAAVVFGEDLQGIATRPRRGGARRADRGHVTKEYPHLAKWAADLRQQYWRRHAFREELTRAFARLGLAPLS
jgi:hypothetical protein